MSIVYIEGREEKPRAGDRFQAKLDAHIATRRPEILLREIYVKQRLRFNRTLRGLNVLVDLAESDDNSKDALFPAINTPGFRIDRLISGIKTAVYASDIMGRPELGMKAFEKSWSDFIASLKGIAGGVNSAVTRTCGCPAGGHEILAEECAPVGRNLSVRIHGDVRAVVGVYFAMQPILEALCDDKDVISAVHGMDFVAGNRDNAGNLVQLVPR